MTRTCWAGLLGVLLSGCIGAETVECASGGLCPPGTECRMDRGTEVCVPATCGNSTLEPGEDCDDGNTTSGDGCQATCRVTVRPAPRDGVAVTYETRGGRIITFGGRNGVRVFDDTWAWDGASWSELPLTPAPRPAARHGAAMTYDSIRGSVLMFGGYDLDGRPLDDFYSLSDLRWYGMGPAGPRPSARAGAAMAFDRVRGVVVLFGGLTPNGVSDETWEWNGVEWFLRTPTAAPSPREGAAMTYDEARAEVMLVGGVNASDNNTWIWNGTRWATIGGLPTPTNLLGAHLAFDRVRRVPVLYGGVRVPDYMEAGGTWELRSSSWVERAPLVAPPPRIAFGMTYVDTLQGVTIFAGNHLMLDATEPTDPGYSNDLWTWDGVTWREYQ